MDAEELQRIIADAPRLVEEHINAYKRENRQKEVVVETAQGRIRIFSDENINSAALEEPIRNKYEAGLAEIKQTKLGCLQLAVDLKNSGVASGCLTTGPLNTARLVSSQHTVNYDEIRTADEQRFHVAIDFTGQVDYRPELQGSNRLDRIVLVADSEESLLKKCQEFYDSEGPWHIMSQKEIEDITQ